MLPDVIFDSAGSPTLGVSEIGKLASAHFLRPDKIVIADRTSHELHFLDLTTGEVVTAGGRGDGPGEIRGSVFQTIRTGRGVAVWDLMAMRVTHFSSSGVVTALRTLPMGTLRNLLAPLTAVFSDGAIVFRDGEEIGRPRPAGRYRHQVRYLEFPMNGDVRVITEKLGAEEFHRTHVDIAPDFFSSGSVIFGHELHDAQAGDLLVVAQTDLPVVQLLRRDGSVATTIPLSPGEEASAKDVELVRSGQATRDARLRTGIGRLGAIVELPSRSTPANDVPANDTTPSIGDLLVDLDGRVWLKSYDLPSSSAVRWRVWKPGGSRPEFELVLPHSHSLLDAHDNLVLLHAKDDLGVDRVVIQEVGPMPEPTPDREP